MTLPRNNTVFTARSGLNRSAFGFAVLLILAGCGGGSSDAKAPAQGSTSSPPAAQSSTAPTTIASLEASGELPRLDRSDSLAGPDANANGIRDDIDAYLSTKKYDGPQLSAAQQTARSYQLILTTGVQDGQAVRQVGAKMTNALVCLSDRFTAANPSFSQVAAELEKLTMNTKPRVDAYVAFNKAMSGSATALPEGDTCAN